MAGVEKKIKNFRDEAERGNKNDLQTEGEKIKAKQIALKTDKMLKTTWKTGFFIIKCQDKLYFDAKHRRTLLTLFSGLTFTWEKSGTIS